MVKFGAKLSDNLNADWEAEYINYKKLKKLIKKLKKAKKSEKGPAKPKPSFFKTFSINASSGEESVPLLHASGDGEKQTKSFDAELCKGSSAPSVL